MAKTTAAAYAQLRRDKETEAREALKTLIPKEFFTTEIQDNGEFNVSTKVFLAAKCYVEVVAAQHQDSLADTKNKVRKPEIDKNPEKDQSFHIPNREGFDNGLSEDIRRLRQVASRLVHKTEERMMATNGISEDLKSIIDTVSDHLIDIIDEIEKA